MNWQQRSGQIYANLMEPGLRSIRAIAAATGIASSVHRLVQAIERRHQYPESPLWEHPSGYQWLHRLVWAVVYVFGVKRHWQRDVVRILPYFAFRGAYRCFPMPCRVRAQIEQQILNYRDEQQAQLQQRRVLKSVGQMRPFEQMVFLLDLPSGYIFVESQATARLSDLARASATGAGSIACVKYLVSDRAQAQ